MERGCFVADVTLSPFGKLPLVARCSYLLFTARVFFLSDHDELPPHRQDVHRGPVVIRRVFTALGPISDSLAHFIWEGFRFFFFFFFFLSIRFVFYHTRRRHQNYRFSVHITVGESRLLYENSLGHFSCHRFVFVFPVFFCFRIR